MHPTKSLPPSRRRQPLPRHPGPAAAPGGHRALGVQGAAPTVKPPPVRSHPRESWAGQAVTEPSPAGSCAMHLRWHPGWGRKPTGPEELLRPSTHWLSAGLLGPGGDACLPASWPHWSPTEVPREPEVPFPSALASLLRILGPAAPPAWAGSAALCTDRPGRRRTPTHLLTASVLTSFFSFCFHFIFLLHFLFQLLCSSALLSPLS